MRNGDYIPTRLEAQSDAANLIVNQKTGSNPESTVGVISMSSSGPSTGAELLVSPTDDLGKILSALHGVPLSGEIQSTSKGKDAVDIAASVQVAALALKHRRNKNGAQRIVLFVGSPLSNADKRAFVKAGKQLKKNNVFIDVIALGELEENEGKLRELVDAANGTSSSSANAANNAAGGEGEGGGAEAAPQPEVERTCHFVTIPAGVLPSDVLVTSPILRGDGGGGGGGMGGAAAGTGGAGGGGGGDTFADFGGVDPSMDPELAMALRVSMEEERARQERASASSNANNNEEEKSGESGDNNAAEGGSGAAEPMDAAPLASVAEGEDEDALLQQALAMSMAEAEAASSSGGGAEETATEAMDTTSGDDAEDEDAAMQMALAMSMQGEGEESAAAQGGEFQDPAFVNQLLGSLPGVNPDEVQEALRKANEDKKDDKDDKKDDK